MALKGKKRKKENNFIAAGWLHLQTPREDQITSYYPQQKMQNITFSMNKQ